MNEPTPLLLAAIPAIAYLSATLLARVGHRDTGWRIAEWSAGLSMLAAAAALVFAITRGPLTGYGVRLDAAGSTVSLLVAFIGWVIVRYSHRYLQGERDERRYLRLLCATLAAVAIVLVADHLLLLAGAWIGTSLTLHRLLRFYSDRAAARTAAHKKFLSARAADVTLLGAVSLLAGAYGTFSLDAMLVQATFDGVPAMAQAGLVLLVVTALLKCAQLPLHGWLIQVMEAPTPVSALLHAGVVNLGGFVLIRVSPLLGEAPVALVVLATVATMTVVLATLVLGTRISVKVALAWSTVAQMGFMLLQVAIGLPAMALLHLVAHSLYKAHAFLSAGGVVQRQQAARLATPRPASPLRWLAWALVLPALIIGAGIATRALATPAEVLAGLVLGLALVPLAAAGRPASAGAVALAWFAGHAVAASLLPIPAFGVPTTLVAMVATALLLLFALQAAIALRPGSAPVRRLYPWAYGGFYVDERVSRTLLSLWPVPHDFAGARAATPQPAGGSR